MDPTGLNAHATLPAANAAAAAADQKSLAAEPPAVQRTTAAAGAALAAAQTAPQRPPLDAARMVKFISPAFTACQSDFPVDLLNHLSLRDIIAIAQTIFMVLPARTKPNLALLAVRTFVHALQKASSEKDLNTAFETYWKEAQLHDPIQKDLKLPLQFATKCAGYNADAVMDAAAAIKPIPKDGPSPDFKKIRVFLLTIISDFARFFLPLFQSLGKEAERHLAEFEQRNASLAGVKREADQVKLKGKVLHFESAQTSYDKIITHVKKMTLHPEYTLPKFAVSCLSGATDDGEHAKSLVLQFRKFHPFVSEISVSAMQALRAYEAALSFSIGFPTLSCEAEQVQLAFIAEHEKIRAMFCFHIVKSISAILENAANEKFLSKPCPESDFKQLIEELCAVLKTGKRINSKRLKVLKPLRDSLITFKADLFKIYFNFIMSEPVAARLTEATINPYIDILQRCVKLYEFWGQTLIVFRTMMCEPELYKPRSDNKTLLQEMLTTRRVSAPETEAEIKLAATTLDVTRQVSGITGLLKNMMNALDRNELRIDQIVGPLLQRQSDQAHAALTRALEGPPSK